jgi:thioredoxin 1
MDITAVTAQEYPTFVTSASIVLIHFWADWNLYDTEMHDRLASIDASNSAFVKIGSFDTSPEDNWAICREVGVKGLPSLVYYLNGNYAKTTVGLQSTETIQGSLNELRNERP